MFDISVMSSTIKIPIASFLLLAFSFFSVGVPVVTYLCPLMNLEEPLCLMERPEQADGSAISSLDCCGKIIKGERNLTPYRLLSFQSELDNFSQQVPVVLPVNEKIASGFSLVSATESLRNSDPPLYLLGSAFLI
jgi:hypothetical protein